VPISRNTSTGTENYETIVDQHEEIQIDPCREGKHPSTALFADMAGVLAVHHSSSSPRLVASAYA
jgi:hypothetical protein